MNVSELRAAIRARGFEADTAAEQLIALNDMQRRLAGSARGLWTVASTTVAVVAGTGDYTLPSAPAGGHVKSLRLLYAGANAPLRWTDDESLLEHRADYAATGTPVWWALIGPATLSLWPTPAAAGTLTVRYHRGPPALTSDSDTPILPELYHDLLVVGACMLVAQRERQGAVRNEFDAEFETRSRDMRAQQGVGQQQTPRTIGASGFYG
jgi:hypothetical protein